MTERRTYIAAYLPSVHDHPIWQEVADALDKAIEHHAPMHSPHEGHSVIREEMDELWEHVRADTGRTPDARSEAIQIAAMGLRYALDLCAPDSAPRCCDDPEPHYHGTRWVPRRPELAPDSAQGEAE